MLASSVLALALLKATMLFGSVCSVIELRESPGYLWRVERVAERVDSATQIVRARVIRADPGRHTIALEPIEWLRGAPQSSSAIEVPGVAVPWDDFNDLPVPYQMVRPSGRHGNCHAEEYRLGGQYLLLLKQVARLRSQVYWWPLGPVNEQLRGDNDAWLGWVRARVAKQSSSRRDT